MANSDLRIFMDNLKKIIHGKHQQLINYNPLTLSSIDQHHYHPDELKKVRNLKKRLKDAAEEAQDSIDLFLSALHFTNSKVSPRSDLKTSLDLNKIQKSINSIKVELKTINIGNMKMDSSSRIEHVKTESVAAAAAGTSYTRNPLGIKKPSEEIVVGLDHDAEIIRDKLTEDAKQLCVVSIVGMGGLGKTTLATKLFNDPSLKYHFHIRAWATVSQTYIKRDFLVQILTSIGVQKDLEIDNDSKLREKLHKKLMGRRYLIVIDDIWSIEAWDDLKIILLTSRLNEVALHVKPHGFVHSLPCLTKENSWELLKQKVFHGDECPEWLIEYGRKIARKCQGIPLSVVVMAGVLAKEPMSKDLWEEIACSISSYHKGNLETLALSYHHLPDHLRECFLYLGGFPEDFKISVRRLICLWVAEGFIEEVGNQSLEDTAKAYLMDLISRNLVTVAKRDEIGDVKAFKLHDLVRELCLQKAKEEGLFLKIDSPPSSSQFRQRRAFTNQDVNISHFTNQTTRSLLCFHKEIRSVEISAHSFVLLRVLDLLQCHVKDFPEGFAFLVHLRYLAIRCSHIFPKSICKLWSLQTLVLQTHRPISLILPCYITDLVNLRHLWSNSVLHLPYSEKPMNLHSISKVNLGYGVDNLQKCLPNIKDLALYTDSEFNYWVNDLELLHDLENLELTGGSQWGHIKFPATLKKLSLKRCELPWSHMSVIQLLPQLEVLELKEEAFTGRHWDAFEQRFRQLKFLKLEWSDIEKWEASSTSFPCLKRLSLHYCKHLEEIPIEIGEIETLELIEINWCSNSVVESIKRIQEEQHDAGNYELKITVDGKELSFYLSQHESSKSE
ncbi:hypothetical protein OSB04_016124 [Centaurea solstitialis]|uniref:NB-ARC domain-containing protein n=1 Tax=Centaurea solstitialis TaxID=347529 RepID=A0AA38WJE3_9ASTR|nr:hypothetical protein OSB04_016124 [Centaurea solstitialis]